MFRPYSHLVQYAIYQLVYAVLHGSSNASQDDCELEVLEIRDSDNTLSTGRYHAYEFRAFLVWSRFGNISLTTSDLVNNTESTLLVRMWCHSRTEKLGTTSFSRRFRTACCFSPEYRIRRERGSNVTNGSKVSGQIRHCGRIDKYDRSHNAPPLRVLILYSSHTTRTILFRWNFN